MTFTQRRCYTDGDGGVPTLINSLARGLFILRLLADSEGSLGVREVAERLEVDPSTAYRLLATLERDGFIVQDAATKKYALGYRILEIGSTVLRRLNVAAIAGPHLRVLTERTGESSHLAVREGLRAVFVARESAAGILRVETSIGASEPVHCTAVGKALLFDLSRRELEAVFGSDALPRFTPQTITTVAHLALELDRSRAAGYAYDDEELHPGVRCLAMPVHDHRAVIVASLGISAPATRLVRERLTPLCEAVRATTEALATQLGYVAEPASLALS